MKKNYRRFEITNLTFCCKIILTSLIFHIDSFKKKSANNRLLSVNIIRVNELTVTQYQIVNEQNEVVTVRQNSRFRAQL